MEPQFPAIWPKVARPDDGPEKQERARQFIAKLEHLKCDKIQMSPSACFGCEHNPRDGEKRAKNTKLMETYGHDLQHIERLHDASRMGLLRLSDVTIGEFDGMRRFWWAIERQRQHAQGF